MSTKEYYRQYREKNREEIRKRSLDWYKRNSGIVSDRVRSRKFGLTSEQFQEMKAKNPVCPITRAPFKGTPHVDHDHETGEVRGLLSRNANLALGLLKDDPEALYRAAAYLTLDRGKPLIYVIGSLRNERVPEAAKVLREAGFDAFDNWYSAGPEADDYWKKYAKNKGQSYLEAIQSREAGHVFRFDKAYLDLCVAAVMIGPAGKSGHLELGYILGQGKPGYILLDEETEKNRYDVMPQFATMITTNLESIVNELTAYQTTKSFLGSIRSTVPVRQVK